MLIANASERCSRENLRLRLVIEIYLSDRHPPPNNGRHRSKPRGLSTTEAEWKSAS